MKAECLKEKLKNVVIVADRITGKNLSLPILSQVLLQADDRVLKIRATNLDLGVELKIPARVDSAGVVAVSGALLGGVLANITNTDKVVLEESDNLLVLGYGRHKSSIKTLGYQDFPIIPQIDGRGVGVDASQLVLGLNSVSFAASLSHIKQEIASVYIYQDGGQLVFVATDSFRLAEKRISLLEKSTTNPSLIIPIKNVLELARVFDSITDDIILRHNQHQLSLANDQIYITSRLIDGVYPDYQQIIPKTFSGELVVARDELLSAIKLSSVFTDKFNQIELSIKAEETLISSRGELGENQSVLSSAKLTGEDLIINLNARYLLDGLQIVNTKEIMLQMNGVGKPIVLTGVGDSSFVYLIMPINR